MKLPLFCALVLTLGLSPSSLAEEDTALKETGPARFTAERVFDIEYATDPHISPDGQHIVYVRHSMDKRSDTDRGDLWHLDLQQGRHRPLVTGGAPASAPLWSPDGDRLAYITQTDGRPDLRLLYFDTRQDVSLARLEDAPRALSWSPDGTQLAFAMFVPGDTPSFATPPAAPKNATWSEPVRVFDDLVFRFDGRGYRRKGVTQIFTLSADGGTPRQVTRGDTDFSGPAWRDAGTLLITGNLAEDAVLDPIESEIYALDLSDLSVTALTDRDGPDRRPAVSPDGRMIAYLGYDDRVLSYQKTQLYVMNADGSDARVLTEDFDRAIGAIAWSRSGDVYAQVEDTGRIDLLRIGLDGQRETILTGLGGTSIGRPYASGSFTLSGERRPSIAYTAGFADRPAEIGVARRGGDGRVLTALNADLLPHLDMARVEEVRVPSRHDGLDIQAWVALPPGFEANGQAPMILEIHGGPYTMYGPYFASEIQRYAAEGYVTVWSNPRGSTGYGEAFSLEIDQAYPGNDYEDLMSVVDALVDRNYVDPDRLFVTGGSGGGILTAWIVGKTDRFAAAASVKPVINWMTMALTADIAQIVRRHWIRAVPWEDPDAFLDRSPIMLIDNVVTPTLVMVGEEDWRTPTWEAEQFYTALKMAGVETALIRIPGASHYIAGRPSRLIAKTDNIMGWFAAHDPGPGAAAD